MSIEGDVEYTAEGAFIKYDVRNMTEAEQRQVALESLIAMVWTAPVPNDLPEPITPFDYRMMMMRSLSIISPHDEVVRAFHHYMEHYGVTFPEHQRRLMGRYGFN